MDVGSLDCSSTSMVWLSFTFSLLRHNVYLFNVDVRLPNSPERLRTHVLASVKRG
jgi:hypothetical protein